MLHKVLYEILASDDTDNNPVTQLAYLQDFYPDLTTLDGIEYYYLSLKTLLGDTSASWAVNKIYYEEYGKRDNNWLGRESEMPFIVISSPPSYKVTNNNGRKQLSGDIKISVSVSSDDSQSSNIARNIGMRIIQVLGFENMETGGRDTYTKCLTNYGLSHMTLVMDKIEPFLADQVDIYYRATFNLI